MQWGQYCSKHVEYLLQSSFVYFYVNSNWYSRERQKWKGLKCVYKANQCCQWPDWLLWLNQIKLRVIKLRKSWEKKMEGLKAEDNQCCQWPDWLLWLRPVCANCRVMPSHQGSAARLVYNQHSPPTPPHNHQCTLGKSSCACFLNCIVCFARSNRKWPAMIYHGANNRMSLLVILLLIISICSRPQLWQISGLIWFAHHFWK